MQTPPDDVRVGHRNVHAMLLCTVLTFAVLLAGCGAGQKLHDRRDQGMPVFDITLDLPRMPLRQQRTGVVSIIAGGDVMLGHWTGEYLERYGADYPFEFIRPLLLDADIAFANLEAPFADSGSAVEGKTFTFKVPTRHVSGLVNAGFDVLSLANNHMLDFGIDGLRQTLSALSSAGLQHAGAGLDSAAAWRPALLQTPAGTVAVLAFSMTFPKEFWVTDSTGGTAYPHESSMIRAIEQADRVADYVVVSFHWGAEKRDTPKDYQIYFAHKAIDAGADLILGHHPHVLQGLELYRGRLIAYSLGNLAFSAYSRAAVNSMLLKVVLYPGGLLYAKIHPLNVDNAEVEFQPRLAGVERHAAIISHLDTLSRALNSRDVISPAGLIFDLASGGDSTASTAGVRSGASPKVGATDNK